MQREGAVMARFTGDVEILELDEANRAAAGSVADAV